MKKIRSLAVVLVITTVDQSIHARELHASGNGVAGRDTGEIAADKRAAK